MEETHMHRVQRNEAEKVTYYTIPPAGHSANVESTATVVWFAFVNLTPTRVTWEERASTEELFPPDWLVGHFFFPLLLKTVSPSICYILIMISPLCTPAAPPPIISHLDPPCSVRQHFLNCSFILQEGPALCRWCHP